MKNYTNSGNKGSVIASIFKDEHFTSFDDEELTGFAIKYRSDDGFFAENKNFAPFYELVFFVSMQSNGAVAIDKAFLHLKSI